MTLGQAGIGPDQAMVFLHIEKTGGTSTKNFLESKFRASEVCPVRTWTDLSRVCPTKWAQYRLIHGQYSFGLHEYLEREAVYVTLLRDPVDRTVSHFNYLCSELFPQKDSIPPANAPEHHFVRLCFHQGLRLNNLVFDPAFVFYYVANFQTRILAGEWDRLVRLNPSQLSWDDVEAACRPELLDRALENLRRIEYVGVTERLDLFFHFLSGQMNWLPPSGSFRYNRSVTTASPATSLDRDVRAQIERFTRLDHELHREAGAIFDRMVRERGISDEEMERRYLAFQASQPRLRRHTIDFSEPWVGDGWHGRGSGEGDDICWTGRGRIASLDLPLSDESDLNLLFWIASCMDPAQLSGLKVRVNGTPLDCKFTRLERSGLSGTLWTRIPREVVAAGRSFSRIEFEVPFLVCPADVDPKSVDSRTLGLFFRWIHFSPAEMTRAEPVTAAAASDSPAAQSN